MKKLLKNKKGFTLIELIVVIAILAILAAILIPSITTYIDSATRAKDAANARSNYTEVALALSTNVTPTYLSGCSIPSGGTIDDFTCTIDGYIYSVANDFQATAVTP